MTSSVKAKAKKTQPSTARVVQTPMSMTGLLSPEMVRIGLGNVSKNTFYRLIREGKFPPADCRLSEKTPRWSVGLFNAWIEANIQTGKVQPIEEA